MTMTAGYQGKIMGTDSIVIQQAKTEERFIFHENEAQILYKHGGELLKEGTTFCDYYGEGTCRHEAIKTAKEHAAEYSVTKESSLVIEVELRILKVVKKKTGRKQYFHPDEDEYEQVGFSEVIGRMTIWSSKNPEREGEVDEQDKKDLQ